MFNSTLFEPRTKVQNDAITNAYVENVGNKKIWTGITDMGTEGVFAYADGSEIAFSSWAPNEPNQSGNQDCVALYACKPELNVK